jgi:3-isopropylmalate/(R)-2-methylmalate dehydratase large subunit
VGKTIVEKILSAHSTEEAVPGTTLWIDVDVRTARDFGGANVVGNVRRHYPGASVADPNRTFFTFDCVAPANNIPYANNQQVCRRFAEEQGVRVYDVDRGIGTHVLIEEGVAVPGSIVVGTDSHMNLLGAVGCLGQGMGDVDIAFTFRTGRTWFQVPPTILVELRGTLAPPASAKDLTLAVVGHLGSHGAIGRVVEIRGEALDALGLDGRITLCSMATEMSAVGSILPPSGDVLSFLSELANGEGVQPVQADADASYERVVSLDVGDVEPLVSCPPAPDNVKPVADVAGLPVNSVFLGSCTNGRASDFRTVARILEGKRVAPGVMFRAKPATRRVYGQLLRDGVLQTLHDAGVIVSHPGCGGCASGQLGMTGAGEVQLSTGNRNFPGKQGRGDTYLVSPATAASSALAGRVEVPQ